MPDLLSWFSQPERDSGTHKIYYLPGQLGIATRVNKTLIAKNIPK